jgi:hypothetical protein
MRTNRVTALLLVATLGVAACGSSSSSSKSSSSSSSSASSSSASSSSASSATPSLNAADLQAHLLTAADLGAGLQDGTFTPPDPSQPLPCNGPDAQGANAHGPDAIYPPETLVGSQIDSADLQAQFKEELRIYADEATANSVTSFVGHGFACASGTLVDADGSTHDVQLTPLQDVTSELTGATEAAEWQLTSTSYDIVEIVARQGNVIVVFQFVAVSGADTSKLPNPLDVAKAAVAKLAS